MTRPFLTLGTVQFGHPYGLRRHVPLMTNDEVSHFLEQAVLAGIRHLDTASAYGLAERRIGEARARGILPAEIKVITKTPPTLSQATVQEALLKAKADLHQERLDVLMLHRWDHRTAERGAIWKELLRARDNGDVAALGASVYTPEEACQAAKDPDVTHLQIPFNVLDWRWELSELPQIRFSRPDLTIYARSVYLQGILLSPTEKWPKVSNLDANTVATQLDTIGASLGRRSRKELCFSFVQSQKWIDSLVLGMDNVDQLKENCHLASLPSLSDEDCAYLRNQLPHCPETLLNPSLWDRTNA